MLRLTWICARFLIKPTEMFSFALAAEKLVVLQILQYIRQQEQSTITDNFETLCHAIVSGFLNSTYMISEFFILRPLEISPGTKVLPNPLVGQYISEGNYKHPKVAHIIPPVKGDIKLKITNKYLNFKMKC